MIWSRWVFSLMFSVKDQKKPPMDQISVSLLRVARAPTHSRLAALLTRSIRAPTRERRERRRPRAAYFSSRVLFLPRIPTTPLLSTISPAQLYNTSAGSHTHRTHHAGPFDF